MIIHKTEINNETDEFSTYYPFRVYLWCDLSIEKWICFWSCHRDLGEIASIRGNVARLARLKKGTGRRCGLVIIRVAVYNSRLPTGTYARTHETPFGNPCWHSKHYDEGELKEERKSECVCNLMSEVGHWIILESHKRCHYQHYCVHNNQHGVENGQKASLLNEHVHASDRNSSAYSTVHNKSDNYYHKHF